jgi:hypothetical protein
VLIFVGALIFANVPEKHLQPPGVCGRQRHETSSKKMRSDSEVGKAMPLLVSSLNVSSSQFTQCRVFHVAVLFEGG